LCGATGFAAFCRQALAAVDGSGARPEVRIATSAEAKRIGEVWGQVDHGIFLRPFLKAEILGWIPD
jgi:hypothetical protein